MRRLLAAIGTCGLAIGGAAGGDPPPTGPTVPELITRLGSGDFREREAASAALKGAGPGAIPALRAAAKSDDPEVRERAAAVLFRLQRTANSVALLAPKKVAVAYHDVPLGTAVDDLSRRTGVKLALDPGRIADPLRRVTCATDELPVWEAIERFCAAAGLEEVHRLDLTVVKPPQSRRGYAALPQPPAPDAVPVLLGDGTGRLPGARGTAVRVVPLPRSFSGHRVTLGTGETTLCFDIAPVPGLNWQDVVAVRIDKLIDDTGCPGGGGSVAPAPVSNEYDVVVGWGGGPGGGFVPALGAGRFDMRTGMPIPPESFPNPRIVPVPLKLGTPTARSIKRLEGHVAGEIQVANQQLITIHDPAKRTNVAFNGPGQTRLTVTSVAETPAGTTVQVTLQHPSPWAVGARRGWNPGGVWPEPPRGAGQTPVVKAFDAAGKELAGSSGGGYGTSGDDGQTLVQQMSLTYRKEVGVPAKLVLVGPRPVIVEVPFVLENVPLP